MFVAQLLAALTSVARPPTFTLNVTVFHVFPNNYGGAPVNMDSADMQGDMFFDLRGVSEPLECAHPTERTAHDCDNPEVVAPNLVIQKVMLEVDNTTGWGEYGRCNVCVNGTDHHGNNSCTNGMYWCDCGSFDGPPVQCPSNVGRVALRDFYGNKSSCHSYGSEPPQLWDCWKDAVAQKTCIEPKTGGYWYSTTSDGYCGDGRWASRDGCSWRVVEQIKRVNKTCSDNSIYSAVEKYGKSCFSTCDGVGPTRNTSSACWIKCFYATVVGPTAGQPGGTVAGMPLEVLEQAWEAPFASDDPTKGGCPSI